MICPLSPQATIAARKAIQLLKNQKVTPQGATFGAIFPLKPTLNQLFKELLRIVNFKFDLSELDDDLRQHFCQLLGLIDQNIRWSIFQGVGCEAIFHADAVDAGIAGC